MHWHLEVQKLRTFYFNIMSHFTVLVIGQEPEKQLQPYHEYECTGIEDEYVKFVPAKEDLKSEFEENKTKYSSIEQYAREYYGYHEQDGVFGRVTNPNAKWDWYLLGGRWTGFFKLNSGLIGKTGKPGILTQSADFGFADQAFKSEIDFKGMIEKSANEASERYDKAMEKLAHLPENETWVTVRLRIKDIDLARLFYHSQERCKTDIWDVDQYLISKIDFIQNAKDNALSTFAVVKDGKWYEKGKMGWWANVTNEKDRMDWNKEFNEILQALPGNTLLSLFDCHI